LQHLLSIRHKNVVALNGITKLPRDDGWWLVLEYCEKGNLADLLGLNKEPEKQPKVDIDLRFQFVVDIAAGMNICHINNPPILHRDLKNANIFVTADWVCKVGDFGLSQNLKGRNFKVELDKLGAAGTSQYYPPEILRAEFLDTNFRYEKAVSTKSDVWAFGLMLWEIFTQKKAWKDFLDEIQWNASVFSDELCNKGKLPDMHNIPKQIQDVIVLCLKTESKHRPSFAELVDLLINAQIDYFLMSDPSAKHFWQTHWVKYKWDAYNKVSWEKFHSGLKTYLQIPTDEDSVWTVLKERLLTKDGHVTLSTLNNVLLWFGPFGNPANGSDTIYTRIKKYITEPGFHFATGFIKANLTEQMLSKELSGSFFVRLNDGSNVPVKEAPWTLSVKIKSEIKHYRIHLPENGELLLKTESYPLKGKQIKTLFQLLEELKITYPKQFSKPLLCAVSEISAYGDH